MDDPLDSLGAEAIKKAQESGKLEDLERAANICKVSGEAKRGAADASNQASAIRQEALKNWAQLLVPLLSVLTLGVTLIGQTLQQRDAQRARDDQSWRTALEEFKTVGNTKAPLSGFLPQVRLKPFLKSPEYGQQANQLARLVMSRMGDFDAFTDLYEALDWQSLDEMIALDRSLNHIDDEYAEELDVISKRQQVMQQPPSPVPNSAVGATPQTVPRLSTQPTPTFTEQVEHSRAVLSKELSYVCNKIGEAARSGRLRFVKADLQDVYFLNCDLSKVDFTTVTFSNVIFQSVNLEGAVLRGQGKLDSTGWSATAWWKASQIQGPLLTFLLDKCDPGSECQKDLDDKPSKADYEARVQELCKIEKISCPAPIKYTESSTPAK